MPPRFLRTSCTCSSRKFSSTLAFSSSTATSTPDLPRPNLITATDASLAPRSEEQEERDEVQDEFRCRLLASGLRTPLTAIPATPLSAPSRELPGWLNPPAFASSSSSSLSAPLLSAEGSPLGPACGLSVGNTSSSVSPLSFSSFASFRDLSSS